MFRNDIPSNAAELPADGRIFKNARMNSSACQIREPMAPTASLIQRNQTLAALPAIERIRLLQGLKLVPLQGGAILHETGAELTHAYFPVNAILSLMCVVNGASPIGVAMIGPEGLAGLSGIMGRHSASHRLAVITTGHAYRIEMGLLRQEFERSLILQSQLLRYTQTVIAQMAQAAACSRYHCLEQQLPFCLLQALDRLQTDTIPITQMQLAQLLGVRRESITEVARKLQACGAIDYTRGRIRVLSRERLELGSCECYGVVGRGWE